MPAEAVHLSALEDTLREAPAGLRAAVADPRLLAALRLGALFVDLPYFQSVGSSLLRHALGLAPRPCPWGDRLHQEAPIRFGRLLGEAGARLRRSPPTREAGDFLILLAVGYFSHAALDCALHPLVNRLAREHAAASGQPPLFWHHTIEKLQSALYHELRHGRDYLGTRELIAYLGIDAEPLVAPGPIADTVAAVLTQCFGQAPGRDQLAAWARGYRRFIRILGSPLARRGIPPSLRARLRPAFFDDLDFPGRFTQAVAQSVRWTSLCWRYLSDGVFDTSAREELARAIPEQSLDPAPLEADPIRSSLPMVKSW
jgi:hypothetical protein